MPDISVVANTSPLLYLHQVGCLKVLQQLYGTVVVPSAVQEELEVGKRQGIAVPDVSSLSWVHIRPVASAALVPAVVDLGQGEAEVLALGLEIADSLLILDDQLARRIADLYDLRYMGTLGVPVLFCWELCHSRPCFPQEKARVFRSPGTECGKNRRW